MLDDLLKNAEKVIESVKSDKEILERTSQALNNVKSVLNGETTIGDLFDKLKQEKSGSEPNGT